jgi:hypothetical protein
MALSSWGLYGLLVTDHGSLIAIPFTVASVADAEMVGPLVWVWVSA